VIDEIKKYYGSRVRVIDSPKIVASYLRDILSKNNLLNSQNSEGSTQFYLSDITKNFEKISKNSSGIKLAWSIKYCRGTRFEFLG
jgi:glutamate racemase